MDFRKLRENIYEFETKEQTGHITLRFHKGVLTCYEYLHTEKVSQWGGHAIDHGLLVVEDTE